MADNWRTVIPHGLCIWNRWLKFAWKMPSMAMQLTATLLFSSCFLVFSLLLLWFFLIFKCTPVPSALVLLQVKGTMHCMDENRKKIWSNWMKKNFRKENDSCTWWFNIIMETASFTIYYMVKLWKNTFLFKCHSKKREFWVWAENVCAALLLCQCCKMMF